MIYFVKFTQAAVFFLYSTRERATQGESGGEKRDAVCVAVRKRYVAGAFLDLCAANRQRRSRTRSNLLPAPDVEEAAPTYK